MFYSVRHRTEFRYSSPVREGVMEVRTQPRSEGYQRCLTFDLGVIPPTRVMSYRDFLGNIVHHFDIPGAFSELTVTAQALVEVQPQPDLESISVGDWKDLDALVATGDYWDMLAPSRFAQPTALLHELARDLRMERRDRPLELIRELNEAIATTFEYTPNSTKVDSPIDEALRRRQGVCQDLAHIMIAMVRDLRIPCRYVSGYLSPRDQSKSRSTDSATHAWVEAWLPGPGWIGFDPTNRLVSGVHHVRVAVGRDYADVPPTRGIYKGNADEEMRVAVRVSPADAPLPEELPPASVVRRARRVQPRAEPVDQQQQ